MDDRIWYIYQNSQQMGPFDPEQVKQLSSNSMISREAYLFKVGWKDWRPIEECAEEIGLEGDRVRMYNLSSGEGPTFAAYATEMTDNIKNLGPNPLKKYAKS